MDVVEAWEEALKSYLEHLLSRNMSENTVRVKMYYVREFAELMARTGISPGEVDLKAVDAFLAFKRRKVAPNSLAKVVEHLRLFYGYLVEAGLVRENPFEGVRIKTLKVERQALTVDEVKALVEAAKKYNPLYADIVVFLLWTGLRLEEFLKLRDEDVDLERGRIRVYNVKRDEYEDLPLLRPAAEVLRRRRIRELNSYSGRMIHYIISRCGRLAGLEKKVSPHILRHTFITWMMDFTGDVRLVRYLARHESLETTSRYVHIEFDEAARKLREKGLF